MVLCHLRPLLHIFPVVWNNTIIQQINPSSIGCQDLNLQTLDGLSPPKTFMLLCCSWPIKYQIGDILNSEKGLCLVMYDEKCVWELDEVKKVRDGEFVCEREEERLW